MNVLNEFQLQTIKLAVENMLYKSANFYISDFKTIARMLGADIGGNDLKALELLHCFKWGDMEPNYREQVRQTIVRQLSNIPHKIDLDVPRFLQDSHPSEIIKKALSCNQKH